MIAGHDTPHFDDSDPSTYAGNFLLANRDLISDTAAAQVAQLHLSNTGELIDPATPAETPRPHVILDVHDANGIPSSARWIVTIADMERGRTQTEVTMEGGYPHAVEYDLGHQGQLIKFTELTESAASTSMEFIRTILKHQVTTANIAKLRGTHAAILSELGAINNQQAGLYQSKLSLARRSESSQIEIDKIDAAIRKLERHEQAVFMSRFLPPSMVPSLAEASPKVGKENYAESRSHV